MSAKDRRSGKGCWYYTSIWECPICGRSNVYRERRYDPKPERWQDRYEFHESYDYCDAL